eukprot:TRINITY_DN7323_c0_g2_i19.p1 TRINITY_DN7323_c0_g2~~TRINITY_DN7323_c0_g2_i19.p1  ORF type:complete len:313 (-),score=52.93 TRINITY_DN7323_c0_g2_i19:32-970(-)
MSSITCAADTCTDGECCDQVTCSGYSCGAGLADKSGMASITCLHDSCTDSECCDGVTCAGHICGDGLIQRASYEAIFCASAVCSDAECCTQTTSFTTFTTLSITSTTALPGSPAAAQAAAAAAVYSQNLKKRCLVRLRRVDAMAKVNLSALSTGAQVTEIRSPSGKKITVAVMSAEGARNNGGSLSIDVGGGKLSVEIQMPVSALESVSFDGPVAVAASSMDEAAVAAFTNAAVQSAEATGEDLPPPNGWSEKAQSWKLLPCLSHCTTGRAMRCLYSTWKSRLCLPWHLLRLRTCRVKSGKHPVCNRYVRQQ